ncbi:MAG: hypothetical protein IMF09_04005 [Proteobacteria bacterium]|nr:hypothetical protein [Pseudomonadota bacterium]
MSPLPVGYVLADGQSNLTKLEAPETPIKDRPLKVLCAHRVRDGKQWVMRRKLTELCKNKFQPFTTILTNEVSESAFQNLVQEHPFVICAQGGGLDPSPKAWLTLANGSIPIIKSSPLDDAYSQLPVAFVDEWNEECLSLDKMHEWIEDLAPYFEDDDLRIQTLHRLSLDYWWNRIVDMTISPLTDAY